MSKIETATPSAPSGNSVTDSMIDFYTFDEAVAVAHSEPGIEFVGMKFVEPFSYLGVYVINVYSDEPDDVNVSYEGGTLFDSMGEEDFFDVKEAPAEARELFYARKTDLGDGDANVMGMTSEFVLQEVLPGLSADAKYRDQAHFMEVAGAQFREFWRQH
jgi:hypothetical protein